MMSLIYRSDVERVAMEPWLPWDALAGKTVVITGASGMIGSHLVDVLMERNRRGSAIRLVLVGRDSVKLANRFGSEATCVAWDMKTDEAPKLPAQADYVVHLASNTHPAAYATDPIGTVMMNVMATRWLLDYVATTGARFVYASSVEIYGQNRGDVELFDESYCGYIDCNTLRAGYPESKRCGEALCQAYRKQQGVDFVVPRIARCYGPTLLKSDTKALTQFLANAIRGEDIVLKSKGLQYFSYLHTSDAVSGLLAVMLKGESGTAYNLADVDSDIRLKDLASLIARSVGRNVIFDLPSEVERAGFSTATTARMDASRARLLGWVPHYTIETGIPQTLAALREFWK